MDAETKKTTEELLHEDRERAVRALNNALVFLDKATLQGFGTIDLLKESFMFLLDLKKAVEQAHIDDTSKEQKESA